MNERQANRLLGYPEDARLLIINADDFGMCHTVTAAIMGAWQDGVVTSTTVMTPCPWALHAMQLLKANPGFPFGVHLTLVSEYGNYRWGPVSPRASVPTLIDETGYLVRYERIPELLARASLDEVETEYRAQITAVLAQGLRPTHLDWHCIADGGRDDIFDLTFALAGEYGLAMRIHDRARAERCQRLGLPTIEYDLLDSYHMGADDKSARYARLLRALPPGLTEWAVHPSLGGAEAETLEGEAWRIRRADFDFLTSPEAPGIVKSEGIVLLDYRALQPLWSQ